MLNVPQRICPHSHHCPSWSVSLSLLHTEALTGSSFTLSSPPFVSKEKKKIVLLWERQVTGRFKFRHLLGKLWRMSNNGIVSASVTMSAEVPFEHPNFSTRMKLYCAACRCANVHLFVWNMNPVSVPLCLVNQSTKCNELDSECSRGGGRHLIISAWLCKVNSLWHFPKPAPPPSTTSLQCHFTWSHTCSCGECC